MSSESQRHRSHLPMPNTGRKGLITFDAKDPASKFPPIERLRPPKGAPNVLIVLIDDVCFGATQRLWRALPDTERGETGSGRVKVQSFPHHRAVFAHAPGVADRPQSPFRWHGRHHRNSDGRAGLLLRAAQLDVSAGEDAQAEWLLHRAVRQVSRSAGLGNEPGRTVRCLADRRRRLRVPLRLHRWRGQPVVPDALRGDHTRRAGEDA